MNNSVQEPRYVKLYYEQWEDLPREIYGSNIVMSFMDKVNTDAAREALRTVDDAPPHTRDFSRELGGFFAFCCHIWYNRHMDRNVYLQIPKDVTHGRGYIYSLQYHIVWVTKYRKPIFVGGIEQDVKKYLTDTLKTLNMDVLAMEVMPDHIHLLVDCKPQLKLSDAIKILKGNTARWLFLNHPEIKKQLWGGHLWNPSYFVATVSERTLCQVKAYIDNQEVK